jgi:hypothetical protein
VLYADVLFAGARVVGRDVLHYLAPLGAAVGAGLRGDGSLWWDGGVNLGLPLAARWSPLVYSAVVVALTPLLVALCTLSFVAIERPGIRATDRLLRRRPAACVSPG